MVIDFHTHIFPEKIAAKAISSLGFRSGNMTPVCDATIDTMKATMQSQNVDKSVVLNIATNPSQQRNVNDFAISLLTDERLIPFGSVHPDNADALDELDRLKSAGIKGIKLHPDYQNFFVDDKKMLPIYEKIASLGLITVFHSGVDIGYANTVHCTPERLARVLDCFGNAPVIAAHFGGYMMTSEVLECLCGTPVYIDTAFSFAKLPPDYARSIISAHGTDKILFGTDMPWSSPVNEIAYLNSLGLNDDDLNKILYKNAKTLLNI